jgi:hypothetical protein
MHGLIKERLEDYLRLRPGKKVPLEFEEHLRACEECREELNCMQEQAQLLHVLAPERAVEPAAGFYARVLERIESRQAPSIWSLLLEPAFGRRMVATSLAMAGLLGCYLAFSDNYGGAFRTGPEQVIAVEEHPPNLGMDRARDRDTMLVTLATYNE